MSEIETCKKCGKESTFLVQGKLCPDCYKEINTMTVQVENKSDSVEIDTKGSEPDLDAIKFRLNREWNTDLFSSCESVEEVRQTFKELVQMAQESRKPREPEPSGIAPLSGQTVGGEHVYDRRAFSDYKTMVDYYRVMEKSPNPSEREEAKAILNALFLKLVQKAKREKQLPDVSGYHENMGSE